MTDLEIFHAAPEGATPEELAAYLDEACGDDQDLRASVEALLALQEDPDDYLEAPPLQSGEGPAATVEAEAPGTVIGNYKLLQEIGTGGFGVVYMADQLRPVKRKVALKIIKLGMDTKQVVARFEVERQALAMMDHPNIAKVFDAGATETGRPYFVMELVRGIPVTRFCDEQKLGAEARLRLFMDVCGAVQHAHQKGVIHRDLKPSNVMVTMHDDKPVPKVIDFGVAKATQSDLTDKTLYTRYEQFIGTPAYMSPEQAQMSGLDIDTRSDIYSLGVLLYELLTGTTPFDARELERAGEAEIRRKIREDDPPKPSTRLSTSQNSPIDHRVATSVHALRGDLDCIIMKALEKDRARRYETANGLAMDIERHLGDEPITAAAPSASYRLRKYVRRHRAALSTAAVILTVLVAGLGVSIWQGIVAKQATRDKGAALLVAESAQKDLEEDKALDQFRLAEEFLVAGKADLGVAYLADLLREDPHNQIAAERLVSALVYRDFPRMITPLRSPVRGLRLGTDYARFNTDRTKLLAAIPDADKVCRWDLETGDCEVLVSDPRHGREMHAAVSPDEKWIAIALNGKDGFDMVVVWDVASGKVVSEQDHAKVEGVRFDASGQQLVSWGGGVAKLWGAPSWDQVGSDLRHGSNAWENAAIKTADFSPDGELVVTGGYDGTARIWKTETGQPQGLLAHEDQIFSVEFSPDGQYVATASTDHTGQVWSVASGLRQGKPLQHRARVNRIVFSPDGTLVATASADHTAQLWDAMSGEPVSPALNHHTAVWRVVFNQRGDRLLTAAGGDAQIWDVATGTRIGTKLRCGNFLGNVLFGADDATIATLSHADDSALWAAPCPRPLSSVLRHWVSEMHLAWGGRVNCARFSADGSKLVTATRSAGFKVWYTRTGARIATIPSNQVGWGIRAAFSPEDPTGTSLVTTSRARANKGTCLSFWELGEDGKWNETRSSGGAGIRYAEYSPDGALLLSTADGRPTEIRDARSGQRICSLGSAGITTPQGGLTRSTWAHFDPEGERVVALSGEHAVRVYNSSDGAVETPPLQHQGSIEGSCFSPDGQWVATASRDGTARVWDSRSGDPRDFVLNHSEAVNHVSFSPDGNRILTASNDGTARLWDAQTGKPIGFTMHHRAGVSMAIFSPDGRRIATASYDATARLWDAGTGLPISEPLRHDDWVVFVEFSPDGTRLATSGDDGTARLWEIPEIPSQVPEWFVAWAETVGGKKINEESTATAIAWGTIRSIREKAKLHRGESLYDRIVTWFYDDPNTRAITPFSSPSIKDYVKHQREIEGLYDAVRMDPTNPNALLALAERLRTGSSIADPANLWRAKFYTRQALKSEPNSRHARQLLLRLEQSADLDLTATLVPPDSEWRWLHPLDRVDPAEADPDFHSTFMLADFDDDAWQTGKDRAGDTGGFGYGNKEWFDGVDIGMPEENESDPVRYSAYFRHRFTTTEAHRHLELNCQRDDGIIVYLDGVEVGSDNMGAGEVNYRSPAVTTIGGPNEQTVCRIPLALPDGLPPGEHVLAISLHNTTKPSSDLRVGGITLVGVKASD